MKGWVKSGYKPLVAHQARAFSILHSMKWLGVFLLLLNGILVHRRVTPVLKLPAPSYTVHLGGERHYENKVSSEENNTVSLVRARTQTTWSRGEGSNREATTQQFKIWKRHWIINNLPRLCWFCTALGPYQCDSSEFQVHRFTIYKKKKLKVIRIVLKWPQNGMCTEQIKVIHRGV